MADSKPKPAFFIVAALVVVALLDDVGVDAARFVFLTKNHDSPIDFDMDLAKRHDSENPVYYVQYAHARVCSVLRKLGERGWQWDAAQACTQLDRLTEEHERALLRRLDRFPEVVSQAAQNCEPHQVATYLRELAGDFHPWYNAHKMLVEEESLRNARIALSVAVRQVVANGLDLLGVSAPEVM